MSEDTPENHHASFTQGLRDLVTSGQSVYGPADGERAKAKLAELDARLGLHVQLGEMAPPPPPWSPQRVAQERFRAEFPAGDPAATPMSETLTDGVQAKLDQLGKLNTREQGELAQRVATDFADNTTAISLPYAAYRRATGYARGPEIVDALVEAARPALAGTGIDERLLRLDRQLLELYAARGRAMTRYAERKEQLGVN